MTNPEYTPNPSDLNGPVSATGPVTITGLLGSVPLTVRGVPDDSQDIQEWRQGSNGALVARISATGDMYATGFVTGGANSRPSGTSHYFNNASPNNVGVVIRAAAAPAVDWFEVQGSGGSVFFRVDASGNAKASTFSSPNAYYQLIEQNSGAEFRLTQQTAQAPTPSPGIGKLYFRAGSVSGVKLVALGPNGVETTIADNL